MRGKVLLGAMALAMLTPGALWAQEDLTGLIVNPGYETGDHTGWESSSVWVDPDYRVCVNGVGVYADSYSGGYHMNAWSSRITSVDVHQTVTLPSDGHFRLSAWLRMTDSGRADFITDQHLYVTVGGVRQNSEPMTKEIIGNTPAGWQQLTLEFYADAANKTVVIGAASTGDGASAAGWFQADEWKLERLGDYDRDADVENWMTAYTDKRNEAIALSGREEFETLTGAYNLIQEALRRRPSQESLESIRTAMEGLDEAMAAALDVITAREELNLAIIALEEFAEREIYPGVDALNEALDVAYVAYETGTYLAEDFRREIEALERARVAYINSQADPTPEVPNNYTDMYVKNPSFTELNTFRATYTVPEGWVETSVTGERDIWYGGCQPREIGGALTSGANVWATDFTRLELYQEIKGLPNGIYRVKADVTMRPDERTDQRVYVSSTQGKAYSPAPISADFDNCIWETLTSDYILVTDGRLRIGIESTCGGGTAGWFQVTNFKLYYGGTESGDLSQKQYTALLDEAEDLKDGLLSGDAAVLETAIEKARTEAAAGNYVAACTTLAASLDKAKEQKTSYDAFMAGAYATLQNALDGMSDKCEDYRTVVNGLAALIDDALAADNATSEPIDFWTVCIPKYIEYADYMTVVDGVLAIEAPYMESHKNDVVAQKNDGIALLTGNVIKAEFIDGYLADLKATVLAMRRSALVNAGEQEVDATFLIQTPDCQTGNNGWEPAGWVATKGNGATITNRSQHYTGDGGNAYIDSWNPEAGSLVFTICQDIEDMPNGTYELKAAMRSDGENVFMYAISGETTELVMAPADDNFGGEMWEEAKIVYDETEEASDIYIANLNKGFGWGWRTLTVTVTDHKLRIGMTCDKDVLGTEAFTGTWFSADDFSLKLVAAGDNSDYENATGIDGAEENDDFAVSLVGGRIVVTGAEDYMISTLNGVVVPNNAVLAPGIYIVKTAKGSAKIAVK